MFPSEPYPWNGCDESVTISVPGLAGVVLKRVGPSSYVPPKPKRTTKRTTKRTAAKKSRMHLSGVLFST